MNVQAMMQQAKKIQEEMESAKIEIDNSKFSATKGNVVTVTMFGSKRVEKIEIDESVGDDKEMIADLTVLAVNDCIDQIEAYTKEKMGSYANMFGGML